jgi:hypothetical protein
MCEGGGQQSERQILVIDREEFRRKAMSIHLLAFSLVRLTVAQNIHPSASAESGGGTGSFRKCWRGSLLAPFDSGK